MAGPVFSALNLRGAAARATAGLATAGRLEGGAVGGERGRSFSGGTSSFLGTSGSLGSDLAKSTRAPAVKSR